MSGVVIDSSLALTWFFEDEASPETDVLFERVRDDGAVVPALWFLELSNVLLQAERRGRITASDVAMRLDLITELPISVDQETTARAWREILTMARAEGLTTYDATYLELAVRRGLPLLTKDNELAEAANRQGVIMLPSQAKAKLPPTTKGRRRKT
ncbi:type II toxin-antitoxin system VapC family toxin [Verrucomicrobium sp. 3C]|uniref:type II toxin-antitoxin system VapC family toxin n=1 Tax=Verrucomicrobium sp. 3C TaxID=1134055 RepID=UPI00036412F6|nr:type II toxin-antitoxin system VapC family toxin [Verrucomicrobium sp. 3C]